MDNNNLGPTAAQGADPSVIKVLEWIPQLPPDSREIVLNSIADLPPDSRENFLNSTMEQLKNHPFYGQFVQEEMKESASSEEIIYTASMSQSDILTVESKSQNTHLDSLPPNPSGNNIRLPAPGAFRYMQSLPKPKSQARQNIQNILNKNAVQSFASLFPALPTASGLSHSSIPSVVGQNPNMPNISTVPQSSAGNSIGQGVPSNMFANPQRQIPGVQQVVPHVAAQQKLLQPTLVQSNMQQQQKNLLQPTPQQSSIQTSSVMQPSVIQSLNLHSLEQNQPSSAQQSRQSMQQHLQSLLMQQQQASSIHQQQAPMMQESLFPTQKKQELMAQQPNDTNMLQNQLTGQQHNVGDMQQKQQMLISRQKSFPHFQTLRKLHLVAQQNNVSSMHQQQLGSQSNVAGLQQKQQLHGTQLGNSTMQADQHSLHMLQRPKVPLQLQTQQNALNTLPNEGKQSQEQLSQLQLMSQMQSQPTQLQQQLGLQQQANELQRDFQPGLQALTQAPSSLLHQQNVIDQQKQLYQSQRPLPEMSSASLDSTLLTGHSNGGHGQEEVHQKADHDLSEEIRKINFRLIDTVVEVSEEDVDPTAAAEEGVGTIVKCSYSPAALSPTFKSQYASGKMSQIQPLRLLVPANYPDCSPRLLDKLPVEVSKEEEDLSTKAKSMFGMSLRMLSEPMSLTDIAMTWDACTREVIIEYAQLRGGGSFSSKYGSWKTGRAEDDCF